MSTNTLPKNDHFISLQQAVKMTSLYRAEKDRILAKEYQGKNILANSETFNRAAIEKMLSEAECAGIRIYYGMDDSLKTHAILVGVKPSNEDILPSSMNNVTSGDGVILEEGQRCPDICPPKSPLNT